jgi:hypothetical protein
MRMYLAGPMRGVPEFNHPAFRKAATILRLQGHVVFSPAENDIETFGIDFLNLNQAGDEYEAARIIGTTALDMRRKVIRVDLNWICDEAEAIALLPGWEVSLGARVERALADFLGLPVLLIPKEWLL